MSEPMFAQRGYEGVSMREIAAAVGIQAAALYYHFPDKQTLYLATMDYAFRDQLKGPTAALNGEGPPLVRLQRFVATLVEELTNDPYLLLLLQRERLDGDETRQKLLVDELFAEHIAALTQLLMELAPERDSTLLALTISGMVLFHLETMSLIRLMPGWKPEHANLEYLVEHLCAQLRAMFGVTEKERGELSPDGGTRLT